MNAFATPNIVHFCIVLLVAALMMIPGESALTLRASLALCALFGLVYSVVSIVRMRKLHEYVPVLDDWIWHGTLPFIAYATLIGAALTLDAGNPAALYLVAGAILLLLVIGLHNAWDIALFTATYLTKPREQSNDLAAESGKGVQPPPAP